MDFIDSLSVSKGGNLIVQNESVEWCLHRVLRLFFSRSFRCLYNPSVSDTIRCIRYISRLFVEPDVYLSIIEFAIVPLTGFRKRRDKIH
jgi:hypothetical protein